jgi:lactoylglutathione lyase
MQKIGIPTSKDNVYTELIHFAMSLRSEEKVDELTERLRNDGYEIIGECRWTGDGYYESIILNPENNRVEITI